MVSNKTLNTVASKEITVSNTSNTNTSNVSNVSNVSVSTGRMTRKYCDIQTLKTFNLMALGTGSSARQHNASGKENAPPTKTKTGATATKKAATTKKGSTTAPKKASKSTAPSLVEVPSTVPRNDMAPAVPEKRRRHRKVSNSTY
jgi:hypothetical protein